MSYHLKETLRFLADLDEFETRFHSKYYKAVAAQCIWVRENILEQPNMGIDRGPKIWASIIRDESRRWLSVVPKSDMFQFIYVWATLFPIDDIKRHLGVMEVNLPCSNCEIAIKVSSKLPAILVTQDLETIRYLFLAIIVQEKTEFIVKAWAEILNEGYSAILQNTRNSNQLHTLIEITQK